MIFAVGPFVGTKVPFSSRWSIAAKSPLTGITGSGNGGGNFGPAMKWAGLDGLVGQQIFAGEATRLAYGTEEAGEGRDAFLEKRDPDWSKVPWAY